MSSGNVPNYRGALGSQAIIEGGNGEVYQLVYNDRGADITNGDVYFLSFLKDANSLSPSARPTLDPTATSSVYRQVVVVNNVPLGKTTITDKEWGYVQIAGYCPTVACDNTIEIDDFLQGTDASQVAGDDGTTQTTDSFGIATSAYSAGFCSAILFGERTIIGA